MNALMKLIGLIQIANKASDDYAANSKTDRYVIEGVGISAAVAVVMGAVDALSTSIAFSENLVGYVAATLGVTATQAYPYIRHWFDQRAAKKKAAAEERVKKFVEETGWADTTPVPILSEKEVDISLDKNAPCVSWTDANGKVRTFQPGHEKALSVSPSTKQSK